MMRALCLSTFLLLSAMHASEASRTYPLWDGHESVASYAQRVNLPPTKQLDLGNGVTLDLVLIPAGHFIMGSPEPEKPTVTEVGAFWMIGLGGGAAVLLMLALLVNYGRKRKISFSLRWLLLLTIAAGVCAGGFARMSLALKEAARYATEMAEYIKLPANEKPAHSVTLTQPFYMGKYTVTQEQYTTLMGNHRSEFKGAQLPVECVSWDDATEFCKKLNGVLHDKSIEVRLPMEAEWEYSCRAGTRTHFYSGDSDSDLDAVGWHINNSGKRTHPVGQKKPNAFGLYDMHGNVSQWCEDLWTNHYNTMQITGPVTERESFRVLRGGSWYHDPRQCRSTSRNGGEPDVHAINYGFRVVVAASSKSP